MHTVRVGQTARGRLAALLLGASVVVVVPATVSAAPSAAEEPVRILLLGDSITQGSEGDWTWRYRLWKHLTGAGVDADLVGYRVLVTRIEECYQVLLQLREEVMRSRGRRT